MKKTSLILLVFFYHFFNIYAEQTINLSDLVITAAGSQKENFDTSLPVNIIKANDIEEKIAVSISEIFAKEPGIDSVTAGGGSVHPMIRGLYGERVLVLVNGVRLSEQRPGGNHVFSLDPAQIEKVEVIRGPASVLYGSDALGGVVNFITKGVAEGSRNSAYTEINTALSYESASEGLIETTHLKFGAGNFNAYVGGTHKDLNNLETAEGELPNSFYEGYTLWGGGNYTNDSVIIRADYSFMDADIGIPSPLAFAEDYFKGEQHQKLTFSMENNLDNNQERTFKMDFGWQRHNRHRYRLLTSGIPAVLTGDLEVDIKLDIDTFTMKPWMIYKIDELHTLTTGIDLFYEDASSARTLMDTGSSWVNPKFNNVPVIPDSRRQGIGLFFQDEIFINDKTILTPGLRYDYIEAETDGASGHALSEETSSDCNALSGNIGLLYKLNNTANLYANIGRAFRSPTLLELYFYGPHDVANDIGDPDLDPETSLNLDAGIKIRKDRYSAELSLFYNKIDDYIIKEKQTDGDYEYKNYSEVKLSGAEAILNYYFSNSLTTFTSLAYVKGENERTGDDLQGIPPFKINYGFRYEKEPEDNKSFWFELSGTTTSKQDKVTANENETDGYTIANLTAGCSLSENITLSAAIDNIFDKEYQDHLSSIWQGFGISDQPGQNIKIMVKADF